MSMNISLRIPRSRCRVRVVNLKTFAGFSDNKKIEAYGFNDVGFPILEENNPNLKIVLYGKFIAGINLNDIFFYGVTTDCLRDKNRKLIMGKRVKGYAGIALQLSRNGLSISPEEVEKKLGEFSKSKASKIYVYRLSCAHGLAQNYNKVVGDHDEWIFSTSFPSPMEEMDWSMVNLLLEHLKSDWRILDETTADLLSTKALQKLSDKNKE